MRGWVRGWVRGDVREYVRERERERMGMCYDEKKGVLIDGKCMYLGSDGSRRTHCFILQSDLTY